MNNPSSHHMELIDRYLQAVRFWLPKSTRQEDLLIELGEDLRSQIEDKETELGHPLDKPEVAEILKRCGSPMMVAGRLGPQRHLIGPALFPIYEFVLKMVLLWILVPVFVFIVGPVNLAKAGGDWWSAVVSTLATLWSGLFIAAGTVTLVFAIIERTSAQIGAETKWDPLKLPPLRKEDHKQPSQLKAVCEFGFNIFGLVWLLLVPHYPFLVLGPAAAVLKAGPILHAFYLPFVLVSVAALIRTAITLARPQWTWFPILSQLLQSVLMLVVLHYMIQAITNAPSAPFVLLQDAVRDSPKYIELAAIVNMSILISVAGTWLGLCIAVPIQTWEFLKHLRQRSSGVTGAASFRLL
jgi:hypothetical protein